MSTHNVVAASTVLQLRAEFVRYLRYCEERCRQTAGRQIGKHERKLFETMAASYAADAETWENIDIQPLILLG